MYCNTIPNVYTNSSAHCLLFSAAPAVTNERNVTQLFIGRYTTATGEQLTELSVCYQLLGTPETPVNMDPEAFDAAVAALIVDQESVLVVHCAGSSTHNAGQCELIYQDGKRVLCEGTWVACEDQPTGEDFTWDTSNGDYYTIR